MANLTDNPNGINQEELAKELQRLRDVEGVTFAAIANKTGISRSAISQLVNQGLRVKSEHAQKLLDAPDTDQYGPLLEDIRKLSAGKRRFEIYDAAQLLANYMERQSKGEDKNYVRYGLRELDDILAGHRGYGHE